ncbi:MAG: hypothetical protein ACLTE4_09600 [Christensenellaceae bacterium]|mgnify:FL=1
MVSVFASLLLFFIFFCAIEFFAAPLLAISPSASVPVSSKSETLCFAADLPSLSVKEKTSDSVSEKREIVSVLTAKIDGKTWTFRLSGTGGPFMKELRIEVSKGNKRVCVITPPKDYGFSPAIQIYNFSENEPFLFYSAQSGGSGGYGFYNVYRLKDDKCTLVYDEACDSRANVFSARFAEGYKMCVRNESTNGELMVDVSYMPPEFREKIFFSDCRPKGEKVNINPVSVVFSYYNSSVGLYQLMTFRSVTAVAEVNRLGYIVQNLEFSEGAFRPYFTEFSIDF